MEYFWTHQENIPEGLGFGQFSPAHFIWLGIVVLFTVLISLKYKKSDFDGRVAIRRIIAAVLLVTEVIKMYLIARDGVDIMEYLPLEVCSFAEYSIICDSIWPNNKFFPDLLLTLFLPAAVMALIFPTTAVLPAINYFTINQFLFHGLIIAYVIARFVSGEIRVQYPTLWTSILKICVLVAAVFTIDKLFNKNFMFLTNTEGNPMLEAIWGITGGGIPYLFGLVVFAVIVVHIFFLVFKALGKCVKE